MLKGKELAEFLKQKAMLTLLHAAWHCEYGSESHIRTATSNDLLAATILNRLRVEVESGDDGEYCWHGKLYCPLCNKFTDSSIEDCI